MRRTALVTVIVLVVGALAVPASGANVHLKGGKNAEPSFSDHGTFLSASGAIAGLGNGDVLVTLVATANVTSSCISPGTGEHLPAGQNPAPITLTGSQAIPEEEFKNGFTPFSVATEGPPRVVAGSPDCPNPLWEQTFDDLAFTSAIITVERPVGTAVLTVTCTFSPPTSDGSVPANTVSCTSS